MPWSWNRTDSSAQNSELSNQLAIKLVNRLNVLMAQLNYCFHYFENRISAVWPNLSIDYSDHDE